MNTDIKGGETKSMKVHESLECKCPCHLGGMGPIAHVMGTSLLLTKVINFTPFDFVRVDQHVARFFISLNAFGE